MTAVVATAGHVDHGKSTLVRALTGMDTDRLEEERRRGLSIELGYAWTTWPKIGDVAFVDVPGHRRFVRTTLAGLGPVPVVLLVVAADEGWMPQSAEHLAALDLLDVRRGVLVITKIDRADPARASAEARQALAATALAAMPEVRVSAVAGTGIDVLVETLAGVLVALPAADQAAPPRLWVDRSFSVTGAGQVITGTLPEGTIQVGDELTTAAGARVRVRGIESLGRPVDQVHGPTRVALNIRSRGGQVGRGDVVFAPGSHVVTDLLDGVMRGSTAVRAGSAIAHIGSAAVPCRARPLGAGHVRLTLARPVPLHVGDRVLVRDPGRAGAIAGVTVLDVRPPALSGRGAATRRSAELAGLAEPADVADHLLAVAPRSTADLAAMGLPTDRGVEVLTGWRVDPRRWRELGQTLSSIVTAGVERDPLDSPSLRSLAARLDLPDDAMIGPLATAAGLRVDRGLVRPVGPDTASPTGVGAALDALGGWFDRHPYEAPPVDRLVDFGLDDRILAAAARDGRVLRLGPQLVLAPGTDDAAYERLAVLPEPFRVTDVCAALGTTRRTAVPLLELLDRTGRTSRARDGRRTLLRR